MDRTFIEIQLFSKRWKELGFTEDDLMELQVQLLDNPDSGPIMTGTGGIRKIRHAFEGRGKSGSVRVCYVDFAEYGVIYLITAFSKDEQANLSDEEKNILKKLVKSLKAEAAKNYGGRK